MKPYQKVILPAVALGTVLLLALLVYPRLAARSAPPAVTFPPAAESADLPEADSAETSSDAPPAAPVPAPDVFLYNADFEKVSLSDFRGKPVVLSYWASWCGYCMAELPAIETLYREYGDRIHFLAADLADGERESIEIAMERYAEEGYTFPICYDGGSAFRAFGGVGVPQTFFIDAEGNLIFTHDGGMTEATLRAYVEQMLLEDHA